LSSSSFDVRPLGDRAFAFRWREAGGMPALRAKAAAIGELGLPWLTETVAGPGTIAFYMNDHPLSVDKAASELSRIWETLGEKNAYPGKLVEIPVVYGGEAGPDLAACAERSGLSRETFAALHSEALYTVEMMGFAPGFPYLSGLDEKLRQPRLDSPRPKVPAGSVGIAGARTGVYPTDSPGGWQLIGRTAIPLFRPGNEAPFLLAPGDDVKFVPVPEQAYPGDEEKARPREARPGTPVLSVAKPGLLTTVQDLGRPGWRAFGVSAGGAMDERSARAANLLVGNGEGDALLELTMIGGSYVFERDAVIAICGADLSAKANGVSVPLNRPVFLAEGTTLSFGPAVDGCRAYLALAGGVDVPVELGSRSADPRARIGGGEGRALAAGDAVGTLPPSPRSAALFQSMKARFAAGRSRPDWFAAIAGRRAVRTAAGGRVCVLRLLEGEEWEEFAPEAKAALFGSTYRVEASSDRMGIRLSGESLPRPNRGELVSHGVVAGTIQVPPNGQPIVLGAGCQPTGGYPKIAHVIDADLPLLAQAAPGDRLAFERVTPQEAELARTRRRKEFALLKAGIRLRLEHETKGGAR